MGHKQPTVKKKEYLKMLIVDDNPPVEKGMPTMLAPFGETGIVNTGEEAVTAFCSALQAGDPYDLVCLNLISESDGRETLKHIRRIEKEKGIHPLDGVKIMMTTATGISKSCDESFGSGCEGYLKRPISEEKLISLLKTLSFNDKTLKRKKFKEE